MKKFAALMAGLMMVGSTAMALAASSPDVRVLVKVAPEIAVTADQTLIDLGTANGTVTANVGFHVTTNTQAVDLSAAASPLFKGGSITSQFQLVATNGVPISVDGANPLNFASNVAQYTTNPVTIAGFPGFSTTAITFESGLNNLFDHNVTATFTWTKPSPAALPMGEYSGAVKLYAVANPNAVVVTPL